MAPEIIIAISGVFLAVALLAGVTTSWALARNAPEQRRLRALGYHGGASSLVAADDSRLTDTQDPFLTRLSRLVPKSPKEMTRLQRRLTRAGYPRANAVIAYSVAEVAVPALLFLLTILALGFTAGLLAGIFFAIVGYLLPGFVISHQTAKRQKAIRNGLPDALDLLTVSVEAGSGLDQAIARASEELVVSHPQVAEEMRLITTEIRAGKPRLEAFKNFGDRTGVEDVKSLVSMLVQTDRFGTSVADALRVHSDTSRTKRRQAAEERAGKVGVKLVFPLALCLFPALYVVCFGPVVVKVYRAFF